MHTRAQAQSICKLFFVVILIHKWDDVCTKLTIYWWFMFSCSVESLPIISNVCQKGIVISSYLGWKCDTSTCLCTTQIVVCSVGIVSHAHEYHKICLMYWELCDLLCQIDHLCDTDILSSLYLTSLLYNITIRVEVTDWNILCSLVVGTGEMPMTLKYM